MKKLSVLFSLLIVLCLSLPINCFADTYQANDYQVDKIKENLNNDSIIFYGNSRNLFTLDGNNGILLAYEYNVFCFIKDLTAYRTFYNGSTFDSYLCDVIARNKTYSDVYVAINNNTTLIYSFNDFILSNNTNYYAVDNLATYGIIIEEPFNIYPLDQFLSFVKVLANSSYFFFVGVLAFICWCAHELKKWIGF